MREQERRRGEQRPLSLTTLRLRPLLHRAADDSYSFGIRGDGRAVVRVERSRVWMGVSSDGDEVLVGEALQRLAHHSLEQSLQVPELVQRFDLDTLPHR